MYDGALWVNVALQIIKDESPQLGGALDVNTFDIVSTANGNITLAPHGTGDVVLGTVTIDADMTVSSAEDGYVLTYDDATGKISLKVSTEGNTFDNKTNSMLLMGG
jgi:hypothetical protein